MNKPAQPAPPARGPLDHDVRTRIVAAAADYFARYGYEKTTVSDLAKEIGYSKAYIYKFFGSKQAIGEVICANCLDDMRRAVDAAIADATSASDRFRRMFRAFVDAGSQFFFGDRKLFDIAATAAREPWPSVQAYVQYVEELIAQVVREGRESGEFERKTPLDETANAIWLVMKPYVNPLLLQYNLDGAEDATLHLSNLVLRSLAP